MKKITLIIAFASILLVSCSTYGVKNEINQSSQIKKLENVGIIIRTPRGAILTHSEIMLSIQKWSGAYRERKELTYLSSEDMSEEIYMYDARLGRFAQVNESNSFMKFKTMGVINLFLRTHREELENIMDTNGLDGLIIFEVDGFFSQELQYIDVYSMTVMIDTEFNILFLDRQSKTRNVNEMVGDRVRGILLSDIGGRFVTVLQRMHCLAK